MTTYPDHQGNLPDHQDKSLEGVFRTYEEIAFF
jgi:hypothetical protein